MHHRETVKLAVWASVLVVSLSPWSCSSNSENSPASPLDAGRDSEVGDSSAPDRDSGSPDGPSDDASADNDTGPNPDHDRYEPIEIELTSAVVYDNPTTDVSIEAEITPPAQSEEQPYTLPGFWDGDSTWRIRWAARSPGHYTVHVVASDANNSGLHDILFDYEISETLSATWAPHGFARIDPEHPNYFQWTDGTPLLWVGDTIWTAIYEQGWYEEVFTDALWEQLCQRRAEYGFTVLQAVAWNGDERWEDGTRPFAGGDGSDYDRINPLSWQRLDRRIQEAVRTGLLVYLMISSNGAHFAWPREQQARLQRVLVARYAAYNVAFGGGEEVDRGGFGSRAAYRGFIDAYHALDPYRALVSLHAGGSDVLLEGDAVDFLMAQDTSPEFSEGGTRSRSYNMPYVNGETGYFGTDRNHGTSDRLELRRWIWDIYLGGAAGYTAGNAGVCLVGSSPHPGHYEAADFVDAQAQEMRSVARFMTQPQVRYWTWSRFEELGAGGSLSGAPGVQYAILARDGDGFAVDLDDTAGQLTGTWYDIDAGSMTADDPITINAGPSVRIDPPGPWHVLLLEAP